MAVSGATHAIATPCADAFAGTTRLLLLLLRLIEVGLLIRSIPSDFVVLMVTT
jgi:hypothetical protein